MPVLQKNQIARSGKPAKVSTEIDSMVWLMNDASFVHHGKIPRASA